MTIQSMQRSGWYQLCTYDETFEFNPLATLEQATNQNFGIRRPLAKVSRSLYLPTFGLFRVTLWHNLSIPTPRLESMELAFEHVERQTGYFVTHENEDDLLSPCPAQTCPSCAKPVLNLSFSVGRKAIYCSDACKMKAYRQRAKSNDVTPLRNSLDVPVSHCHD